MNCPSCHRNLASTLSVCFSCGAMLNDSVREELALKISPLNKTEKPREIQMELPKKTFTIATPQIEPIASSTIYKESVAVNRPQTSEIMTKPTSQTLVDFQSKNATLPDWRLQLQNSVRKRIDEQKIGSSEVQVVRPTAPRRISQPMTNGATALNTEFIEEEQPIHSANPTIANALRRIEESRKRYLASEPPIEVQPAAQVQTTVKQFPISPNKSLDFLPKQDQAEFAEMPLKPNVVQFSNESKEVKAENYDTSKLPKLPPPAKISSSFEKPVTIEYKKLELGFDELDEEIHRTASNEVEAYSESQTIENTEEVEEIDDCAPIALRFNAAIFDLLIGSFLSLVLLSPFMLLNGKFFSFGGFFAFLATCAIVMFIYMTTTVAFLGRTFGMRLFALEIVDIEENEYPTLHQAAVSSSIYLLSLAFGGIGFLTMLLNNEKRAAHDLLSKTIVLKEY